MNGSGLGEHGAMAERLFETIGTAVAYGVWVSRPDGRLTYASPSFLNLTGLRLSSGEGCAWFDTLHPEDRERVMRGWEEAVTGNRLWISEHRCRGADGAWYPILARGAPVRNEAGEIACWTGVNLDNARLAQAEAAVSEAERDRDEFLAVLTHELRNPLAPILTSAQLLQRRGLERPDLLQTATSSIERQVKHLSRLIGDLADVSRIARGKITLSKERVDMQELIARAVESSRPLREKLGQKIRVVCDEALPAVEADPVRLGQVFVQLLHNASKFSPSGGTIELVLARTGDTIAVTVRDDGIGIDGADLERIFQAFVRIASPLHGGQSGLGIGLTLARSLVRLHGGELVAVSAGKGRGSEFKVHLPLARPGV